RFVSALLSALTLSATLVPYTTLFRSCWAQGAVAHGVFMSVQRGHLLPRCGIPHPNRPVIARRDDESAVRTDRAGIDWIRMAFDRDRKSTRLNSSHEWISYAVFCLKKK